MNSEIFIMIFYIMLVLHVNFNQNIYHDFLHNVSITCEF